MLTTNQIKKFMKKDRRFNGVYSINRLPVIFLKKPAGVIINLDESWKEGSHWVAIYFPKIGPAFYFDSFGRSPPNLIKIFLEKNSNEYKYIYNEKIFQGDLSILCGYFCIAFLKICPNYNYIYKILNACDYMYNDYGVLNFLKRKNFI